MLAVSESSKVGLYPHGGLQNTNKTLEQIIINYKYLLIKIYKLITQIVTVLNEDKVLRRRTVVIPTPAFLHSCRRHIVENV